MEHENSYQSNRDRNKDPKIFPLSPDSALEETEKSPQLRTYRRYLQAAFDEPRISNIAITGGLGIGKSSIIRSLEHSLHKEQLTNNPNTHTAKNKHKKSCKKTKIDSSEEASFLYISLGSFTSKPDEKGRTKEEQNKKGKDGNQELNIIERRLLLQIYARFHRKDIPLSSFRLIPEDHKRHREIAILCGFITCSILLLFFHNTLGCLLAGLSTHSSAQWLVPLRRFFGLMVSWKPYVHLLLYLFVIATISFTAGKLCLRVLLHLRLSSIALKSNNAEIALEKETCESYLDLYSMEIVYCLEQLVDKIGSTVVFEDFDRLPSDIYIQIFSRLREINYLANLRLKVAGKHIRFIYVINDSLLGDIIHPKFFDYILPIIPYLNPKSSEMVLNERLKTINEILGFEGNSACHVENVVFRVAPYLTDFRLQNTILNEYILLSELYKSQNADRLDEYDAAQLFAFAIYKNIWPDDYRNLFLGKSKIFLSVEPQCTNDMTNYELLRLLTDETCSMLTLRCLYYAGFNEHTVAEMRKKRWENAPSEEIIRDMETIQAMDRDNLKLVQDYCNSTDDEKVAVAAIRCMVRCNHRDNSWFFCGHALKDCLHILAELEDESVKSRFFELSAVKDQENIYNASPEKISELFEITNAELVELCRGVKQFTGVVSILVEGHQIRLSEENYLVKQARKKIQLQTEVN